MPRRLLLWLLTVILAVPWLARAQSQAPSDAGLGPGQRVFAGVGPGFRAIRRGPDGHYFVLVSPGPAVLVFDADGKPAGQVPAQAAGASALVYGMDLDVDTQGRVYVADRGGNAVNVYAANGALLAHVRVTGPTAVAALPRDEFAVASISSDRLIGVYDFQGTLLREFGDLATFVDARDLNRRLNFGDLACDADGNLYFAFEYQPAPTVRKYDRFGYLADEMNLKVPDFDDTEQAARREIARARSGSAIAPREIISAVGVDASTQEFWIAVGGQLAHFDRSGAASSTNSLSTATGTALKPSFILVEPDRLLVGGDPQGIFAFPRLSRSSAAH